MPESKAEVDESIMEYEDVEYQPITGSQLNMSGLITITIENTDDFFHPRHSWLLVEVDLVKAADETQCGDMEIWRDNDHINK